jgi:hypothetical protein
VGAHSARTIEAQFARTGPDSFDVAIGYRPHGREEPLALQVAVPDAVPQIMMLPLWANLGIAQNSLSHCEVQLTRVKPQPQLAVTSTGDPRLTTVTQYMRTGAVRQAAAVAADSVQMLYEKRANPIAASLGGYALLRLGEHGLMHDWPTNLATWFPELPDGPVIAGELCARRGDHAGARRWARTAADRGLPIFTEGLTLLAAQLRSASASTAAEASDTAAERHEVDRVLATAAWSDLDNLYVSFAGADVRDPIGSQHPIKTRGTEETWQRLW